MLAASSRLRFGDCRNFSESARKNGTVPFKFVCLAASALASLLAAPASAQSINFSLNVFYANPADLASGGTWELVAKSSPSPATFGISGVTARISNINSGVTIEGPRANVNVSNIAGFQLLANTFHAASPPTPAYRELTIAQLPLSPLPGGSEQTYFYGVGTLTNGAPEYAGKPVGSNSIGPTFSSLTNPQDIAWATGDVFGESIWDTAARLASGTFNTGVTPGFVAGSMGNVFTSVPLTNTTLGNEVLASTITTIVRTNAAQSADYNQNGIVDAADYVVWRKTLGLAAVPPGSGADGNGDGTVNGPDYTFWRSRFGDPMGAGSGADLSAGTVPEPTSGILLTIGALLILAPRRGRLHRHVNN